MQMSTLCTLVVACKKQLNQVVAADHNWAPAWGWSPTMSSTSAQTPTGEHSDNQIHMQSQ